jgi:stage V sporulation protein S
MEPKYNYNRINEPGLEPAYQAERQGNFVTPIRPVGETEQPHEVEVLKVSGKSRPSSVAGAIAGVVRQAGRVEIQAIGAGATNQAIKAVAIARGYLISSGIDIVCIPAFIDVTIDDEERTAIKLLVERRPGFSGPSTSPVIQ